MVINDHSFFTMWVEALSQQFVIYVDESDDDEIGPNLNK